MTTARLERENGALVPRIVTADAADQGLHVDGGLVAESVRGPGCRVVRTSSASVGHATTPEPVAFDAETYDYGDCWPAATSLSPGTNAVRAPTDGLYIVGGFDLITSPVTGNFFGESLGIAIEGDAQSIFVNRSHSVSEGTRQQTAIGITRLRLNVERIARMAAGQRAFLVFDGVSQQYGHQGAALWLQWIAP